MDEHTPWVKTPLPALSSALEQRYAGVRVKCTRVVFADGQEMLRSEFVANGVDVLVRYGLARPRGESLTATSEEAETFGGGWVERDGTVSVLHSSIDGDYYINGRFGFEMTRSAFKRIWWRMRTPRTSSP